MHARSHYTIKSNCSWINEYWYHTIYQLALLTIKDPLLLGRCKTNNSGPTHLPHGFRTLKKIYRFSFFKNVMKINTFRMVHYKYAILTDYQHRKVLYTPAHPEIQSHPIPIPSNPIPLIGLGVLNHSMVREVIKKKKGKKGSPPSSLTASIL